jgi:hypothetical protein
MIEVMVKKEKVKLLKEEQKQEAEREKLGLLKNDKNNLHND